MSIKKSARVFKNFFAAENDCAIFAFVWNSPALPTPTDITGLNQLVVTYTQVPVSPDSLKASDTYSIEIGFSPDALLLS